MQKSQLDTFNACSGRCRFIGISYSQNSPTLMQTVGGITNTLSINVSAGDMSDL